MHFFMDVQMSGDGIIAARPQGMPHEHSRIGGLPGVVTRLCADGAHRVAILLPDGRQPVIMDAELAEQIGRELLEYSALVRDKIGLCEGGAA